LGPVALRRGGAFLRFSDASAAYLL